MTQISRENSFSNSRDHNGLEINLNDGRFRSLVENLSIGIVVHDANTKILFANQLAANLLGINRKDMEGKLAEDRHWHFIREDHSRIPIDEYPVNQVIITGQKIKSMIIGLVRSDQPTPVWVFCNAYPEMNGKGQIDQIIVNFTDITEEKRLREELDEITNLFSTAMDQSQAGIAIVNARTNKLMYLNQAGFIIRGGPRWKDVKQIGLEEYAIFWEIYDLDGRALRVDELPILRAIKNGITTKGEFLVKSPDCDDRFVLINAAPVFNTEGKLIAGISIYLDITQKHKLEIELRKSREIAQHASNMKGRFLNIAAHELRTPIAALSILIQLTQKRLEKGRAVEAETLEKLQSQIERISHLVVDLLDASRLERDLLKLNIKPWDINSLIKECMEDFKLRSPEIQITLKSSETPVVVNLDSVRIYQVISNLVENAIKYSPEESPIDISVVAGEDTIKVEVKDHGPAIATEIRDNLFKPFTRGDGEKAEKAGGLGLGLYICRSIIELHNGEIGFYSNDGDGNTFYFSIPRRSD